MDAHSSQSFTSTSQGRTENAIEGKDYTWIYDYDGNWVRYWHASHRIDKDVPRYPEPEGEPSY